MPPFHFLGSINNNQRVNNMSQASLESLSRCVLITPEGRTMRMELNIQDMGIRDDLLLKAGGEAAGIPLYGVCHMPNTNPPMAVHIYAAEPLGMAVRLPSLRMNTFWEMVDDPTNGPIMVPTFTQGGLDYTLDWIPPVGCALYLVVRNSTPYLIALNKHPEKGHWRSIRLDIPNLYPDGKLCLGRDFSAPESGMYVERLRAYVDRLFTARWNADLLDGRQHNAKILIRFNAGDGKCLAPPTDWWKCGAEISGTAFNWLAAMAQARRSAP